MVTDRIPDAPSRNWYDRYPRALPVALLRYTRRVLSDPDPAMRLLPVVSVVNVSGVDHIALTYVRQAGVNAPSDVIFSTERSTDWTLPGNGWSTSGVVQHSVTPGPEAGFETVVMRSLTPRGGAGHETEFLRLKVTLP